MRILGEGGLYSHENIKCKILHKTEKRILIKTGLFFYAEYNILFFLRVFEIEYVEIHPNTNLKDL